MKKFIFSIVLVSISVVTGSSHELHPAPAVASLSILSGPTVRIPGMMSTPTVLKCTGANFPVRWKLNGNDAGNGSVLSVTTAGTYEAFQVQVTTNPNDPGGDSESWFRIGSIEVAALNHSIVIAAGPNPLSETVSTLLCVSSNASRYISSVAWRVDNGVIDNNPSSCRTVTRPGVYIASITYSYGTPLSVTATVDTGPILINSTKPYIISGPLLRIPGMSSPTILRSPLTLSPPHQIRWKREQDGADVGSGITANVTVAGTYRAYDYSLGSAPGESVIEIWGLIGSIDVPALDHHITITGPSTLNETENTVLCVSSNGAGYISGLNWMIDGIPDNNSLTCRTITIPGTYSVSVNYSYAGETVSVVTEGIIIKPSLSAPVLELSSPSYTPYDPPLLTVINGSSFSRFFIWYNGQQIASQTISTFSITAPGIYNVVGVPYAAPTHAVQSPNINVPNGYLVNYVRKKIPLIENVTTQAQLDVLPHTQINVATTYADGFARPVQQVQQAMAPSGHDVVGLIKYDVVGREAKKFLPFTRNIGDGTYHHMPPSLKPLTTFYQQNNDKIANTAFPYAETVYEASPLSRSLKQGAPGEDWQVGTNHVVSFSYATNTTADNIWIWTTTATGMTASGYYPGGTLLVTQTTDANGNTAREFKDKTGHVIVFERIIEGGNKFRTYFIYDDLDRLTHVLPPKTIAALPNSIPASIANDIMGRECFSYQYDTRNRMTSKNIPGAGIAYMVYDPWDRVVLTQHANQRTLNKWLFNKYDALNRLVITGEINLTGDYAAVSQAVTNFYATVSTNLSLRYEATGGPMHGYTNRSFPVLASQSQAFAISYYDNYDFVSVFGTGYQFMPEPSLALTDFFSRAQNLLTGTKALVLGTTNYLKTVHYYNKRHQLVQVIADNHLGGIDKVSNTFNLSGKMIKGRTRHQGVQSIIIDKEIVYDHAQRVSKVYHTINNGPKILLAQHKYNELGQMIEKNIHSENETTFLQSMDYAYNIRGWLSQFNPSETETNVRYGDQYSFELSYTTPAQTGMNDFQPSFNGNISAFTETRPSFIDDTGLPLKTAFTYQYDARDQLKRATYYQPSDLLKNDSFTVPQITYDPNGNILSLKRKGIVNGLPVFIDDLTYSYNGNQLIQVNDAGNQTSGFINR